MGVFEALTFLVQAAFMLGLMAIVPIGWFAWSDPSRASPELLDGARVALSRGDRAAACRLAIRAMSWPRAGRYSARQA
jgi:hypothetical protein